MCHPTSFLATLTTLVTLVSASREFWEGIFHVKRKDDKYTEAPVRRMECIKRMEKQREQIQTDSIWN